MPEDGSKAAQRGGEALESQSIRVTETDMEIMKKTSERGELGKDIVTAISALFPCRQMKRMKFMLAL